MEIVKACDAMPCNAEVLKFLQENRLKLSSKSSKDKGQAKAATVVLETITYLEKTPAGKLSEEFTSTKLNDFLAAIEKFKLTPTEKLLLLNHCPRSAVEVQLLVEDSEERLSEDQVDELLQEISVNLIGEEEEEEENEQNETNEEAMENEGDTQTD